MAEFVSPNPTTVHKKKLPMPAATNFFVGSNDDQLERAAARAARAAAIRRTSCAVNFNPQPSDSDPVLNKQQILELFRNCIRLASENVIIS
jgi:condensin complex subunit 2